MAELMLINPRKRRRRVKARKSNPKRRRRVTASRVKRRRRNPVMPLANVRRRRRYSTVSRKRRRNPIGGRFSLRGFTNNTLMPSAIGAAGALGLDVLMGLLPLPAAIKTGPMRPLTRIAGAVGIGMLAGMITNRRLGEQVAAGAVTVVMYDTLKSFVRQAVPTLPMAGLSEDYPSMEYVSPAMMTDESLSAYVDGDMGVDLLDADGLSAYVEGEQTY
jgi:hypothetical protein